jgi:CshA-type fibril repeat protein
MAAYGQNVTFRPWLNDSPGVVPVGSPEPAPQMVPSSVRLCGVNESVPNCASTTLTTDDGTYVVNSSTGAVVFTPVAGFHGTATSPVTYQISNDWSGSSGIATASASLIPTIALPGAPVVAPPDLSSSPDSPVSFDPLAGGLGSGLLASSVRLCAVDEIAPNCTATTLTTDAGTFTVDLTTGQITFTPGPGFSEGAPAALTFAAADSSGNKVFSSVAIAEPAASSPIALVLGKLAKTGLSGGPQTLMFAIFLLIIGAGMVYFSTKRSPQPTSRRKPGEES